MSMFRLGLENLLRNPALLRQLKKHRVGLVAHPASVDRQLHHSTDILAKALGRSLTCAFGPQHGMRGEKQDNMVESNNYLDPSLGIPVFSLYGEVRRPTEKMLEHFDTLLFDLQDVGCRIYTFLTTLFYVLEDCARTGKSVWVLDRPNPAGRPVEGNLLEREFFSFVGGAEIPMRHGLTLGEAGAWYIAHRKLDVDYRVVKMSGYDPTAAGQWGWPDGVLSWVNPSPNIPRLSSVRVYPGSVMVEGTKLSEGRGTTRPLEVLGAPGMDGEAIAKTTSKILSQRMGDTFLRGYRLRPCFFEPTFHKHKGQLCGGVQVHVDQNDYKHSLFKPYRIFCALFKAIHELYPEFELWQSPPYEYEFEKLPIDLISGSEFLKAWVADPRAKMHDLDAYLAPDEKTWLRARRPFLLY